MKDVVRCSSLNFCPRVTVDHFLTRELVNRWGYGEIRAAILVNAIGCLQTAQEEPMPV